jgi:hypothetical protein
MMTNAELTSWIEGAALLLIPGAGAYLGSYLRKKGENLATHEDINNLVVQVSAVTTATKQIEAKIDRASRIHERQLDTLLKLNRHLHEAQGFFKRMTASGRIAGEIPVNEYGVLLVKALDAARDELLNGGLLLPLPLLEQCDTFFNAMLDGQINFGMANETIANPNDRAKFWNAAAGVAHQRVPNILRQIDEAARSLIHGGPK